MTPDDLHVVVPGPLDQLTGGYIYDARMVAGLRERGWSVRVHNLEGRFPDADALGREALRAALAALPDEAPVVIDGLAMGGAPDPIEAHGARLRIVSLVHHPLAEETGLTSTEQARFAESERRALGACAGVVVSSEFTARRLEGYGMARTRMRVVEPGTDPARPAAGPGPGRPPALLCVASLTPRKGHDVLVAALEKVRDLDWTCVCAGGMDRDPAHAGAVLELAIRAGLGDRIRFLGERRGGLLDELYHRASLFALASRYEGYGMALAEALARGLPVVATTGGAIPYTVPAEAALLVEPDDDESFAAALRVALSSDEARAEMASAARRHAATLPSWGEAVERFARAVDELVR